MRAIMSCAKRYLWMPTVAVALGLCLASADAHAPLQQWGRFRSAHITLTAPAGGDVNVLLNELERAHADVRAFGLTLPSMVEARSYPTSRAFVRGSGASLFNLALAVGLRIHLQPVVLLLRSGEFARTLRHEMAHVAMDAAARRGLPRWMNEGMAMTAAGQKGEEAIRFRTLDALEDTLARSRDHAHVRSAYATAERLVAGLVRAYGKARVLALIRATAAGSGFRRTFSALSGENPDRWGRKRLGAVR